MCQCARSVLSRMHGGAGITVHATHKLVYRPLTKQIQICASHGSGFFWVGGRSLRKCFMFTNHESHMAKSAKFPIGKVGMADRKRRLSSRSILVFICNQRDRALLVKDKSCKPRGQCAEVTGFASTNAK